LKPNKILDCPYSAYKLKDDSELIVLAGALELDTTGTILVLKECIKEYLDLHKNELVQNPQFMHLFKARRQHTDLPVDDGGNYYSQNLSSGVGPSRLM